MWVEFRIKAEASFNTGGNNSLGKFNNEPIEESALKDRIVKLECLVGRLILENEFLKNGLQHNLN